MGVCPRLDVFDFPSFSRAGHGPSAPVGRLVRLLPILFLSGSITLAQVPESSPGEGAPEAAGLDAVSAAVPTGNPTPSPFTHANPVLQARKLRGLTGEVASLVLRGEPGGNFAINALALPQVPPPGAEKAEVPFFVEIDGASFLDTNRSDTTRVEVYAYALEPENGGVAAYLAEVFLVNVSGIGEAVWQSGLKFYGHLDLPPGDYTLRLLVRNYQSKAAALREILLNVPTAGTAGPMPPLFPAPRGRDAWMPIREWERETLMADGRYPFVGTGEAVSPATRPVLVAGRKAEAWFFASDLPASGSAPKLELLANGRKVETLVPEVVERTPGGLKLSFTPPVGLVAGQYVLRTVAPGAEAKRSLPLEVLILQQGIREPELLWTDLRWLMSEDAEQDSALAAAASLNLEEAGERKQKKIRKKIVTELAAQYRVALSQLGEGMDRARASLLDLESKVLADSTRATVVALGAAEMQTAESLAASDVESLIPVMMLHESLYRAYRERRLFSLLSHTRSRVESLAVLYAENGGTEGSRVVGARSLASLGGYVQGANLPASSRRLFHLALQYDPANKAALLGLAASHEKYGDYSSAVYFLETLVTAHPSFGEGLLRQGINLRRVGDRLRAGEILSALVKQKGQGWVDVLANEELARVALRDGRLREAALLLEGALRRSPESHGLRPLLAHVYDRLGQQRQAFDVVEGLRPAGQGNRSPRKTYDSWPEAVFTDLRQQLSEAAAVRIPALRDLLSSGGGAAQ